MTTQLTIRWPYPDVPPAGTAVRAAGRVIGWVTGTVETDDGHRQLVVSASHIPPDMLPEPGPLSIEPPTPRSAP